MKSRFFRLSALGFDYRKKRQPGVSPLPLTSITLPISRPFNEGSTILEIRFHPSEDSDTLRPEGALTGSDWQLATDK